MAVNAGDVVGSLKIDTSDLARAKTEATKFAADIKNALASQSGVIVSDAAIKNVAAASTEFGTLGTTVTSGYDKIRGASVAAWQASDPASSSAWLAAWHSTSGKPAMPSNSSAC